jgi:hypothetical protein
VLLEPALERDHPGLRALQAALRVVVAVVVDRLAGEPVGRVLHGVRGRRQQRAHEKSAGEDDRAATHASFIGTG